MIYLINAYEKQYLGTHGIEMYFVTECSCLEDACNEAIEQSYEIMDSYYFVRELLEDMTNEECSETMYSDKWWNIYGQIKQDNLAYSIWEVTNPSNKTVEELDEELIDPDAGRSLKYAHDSF